MKKRIGPRSEHVLQAAADVIGSLCREYGIAEAVRYESVEELLAWQEARAREGAAEEAA